MAALTAAAPERGGSCEATVVPRYSCMYDTGGPRVRVRGLYTAGLRAPLLRPQGEGGVSQLLCPDIPAVLLRDATGSGQGAMQGRHGLTAATAGR